MVRSTGPGRANEYTVLIRVLLAMGDILSPVENGVTVEMGAAMGDTSDKRGDTPRDTNRHIQPLEQPSEDVHSHAEGQQVEAEIITSEDMNQRGQQPLEPDTLPDCVTVQSLGPGRDTVAPWVLEKLKQYAKGPDAPPPPEAKPLDGRTWQDFVAVDGGQLHVRRGDGVGGMPVLVQHGAAGDNTVVDDLSRSMVGKRTVFAFDLPGNGESDNTIGADGVTMARYAEVVGQAMDTLGLDAVDFLGMKGGGLVGLELAGQRPGQVKHLCLNGASYYSDTERKDLLANYSAPVEIDWYGGFLIKCWHMTRDQGLYWPWYRRTSDAIIPGEPHVDTKMVHRRVVALLKAGDMHHHAYQAQFSYPTHDQMRAVQAPVLLCGREGDARTEAAAKGAPRCAHAVLPGAVSEWGNTALEFFAG